MCLASDGGLTATPAGHKLLPIYLATNRWDWKNMNFGNVCLTTGFCLLSSLSFWGQTASQRAAMGSNAGQQLVSFPGAWAFQFGQEAIILVRDDELETLARNPDQRINLSTDSTPHLESLREICERAKLHGQSTITIAFDQFFSQYRGGQEQPRRLRPDSDEYIRIIATVSRFTSTYGIGLQLSLLSPLELGGSGYRSETRDAGQWMQYREGFRDPKSGAFSVQLWRNRLWTNNKGTIPIEDAGIRVFAFREAAVGSGSYRVVDPQEITEVKSGFQIEQMQEIDESPDPGGVSAVRIRVFGKGALDRAGLNRVLVVQMYKTPEMDYFSPRTLPYLEKLVDRYAAAGVRLNGLYSDEMHIQQDWHYFNHHDHGEFAMRYVSSGLAERYAALYGNEYQDFAKYLVYFVHGQEDTATDLSAKQDIMYTFGATREDVQRTALFRARYYKLLQDGVVDLFVQAKHHAEAAMGHALEARAHATWAESPTIDYWRSSASTTGKARYEYTSDFVWSNTVQQAAAACYDYFKWGDYLTGNGNDFAEGGWIDRNYYGLAVAASTGILNEVPNSYAAHWGDPEPISKRRSALEDVYGDSASAPFAMVENLHHRETGVLMLYPLDLVAEDERFGSWMIQYGYADYVTAAKLLERGKVSGNAIEMADSRFTTLVATFEPFPSAKLLELMRQFVKAGGRLIWLGPPPILTMEGEPALTLWQEIFGVEVPQQTDSGITWRQFYGGVTEGPNDFGLIASGKSIRFAGALRNVEPQVVLTDFLIDHVYPVTPRPGTEVVVQVGNQVIGTKRGSAVFLGYRPRDDQSASLGYDERNWFEILDTLGAYPPTGRFEGINDNPDYTSRTGPYMSTAFLNGAIAIAPHLREIEEIWDGGFSRNKEADEKYLAAFPPPSDEINLTGYKVAGHSIVYDGHYAVAFRVDAAGNLIAFSGVKTSEIAIDGRKFVFADKPVEAIAWAPVEPERRIDPGVRIQIMVSGEGTVRIPADWLPKDVLLSSEGQAPGSSGEAVDSRFADGVLTFKATKQTSGRWIYGITSTATGDTVAHPQKFAQSRMEQH